MNRTAAKDKNRILKKKNSSSSIHPGPLHSFIYSQLSNLEGVSQRVLKELAHSPKAALKDGSDLAECAWAGREFHSLMLDGKKESM